MTAKEKSTINIRVDKDLKEDAQVLFDEIGLSMSNAMSIFLKTAVREQKIPFELSAMKREDKNVMDVFEEIMNEDDDVFRELVNK